MRHWRSVTERVERFHNRIRDRIIRIDTERAENMTAFYKKYEHMVPVIARSKALKYICENHTALVEDDELICANQAAGFCANLVYPEWSGGGWILGEIAAGKYELKEDGYYHNPDDADIPIIVSAEDVQKLKEIDDWWQGRKITDTANAWYPEGYEEFCRMDVSANKSIYQPIMMYQAGHLTPGYRKILSTGFKAIKEQAKAFTDAHRNDIMGHDMRKYLFYTAVADTCDAAMILIHRYADAAAKKAEECTDEKRKAELVTMAENLAWIAENPAKTYWQALQLSLLYKELILLESNTPCISFGRFDQYTWPYLERDLKEGRIDMDFAQELTDIFFLKTNAFYSVQPANVMKTVGVGNTYQHTTIGGIDPHTGMDAENPVTYMVLETLARLSLHDPTVSLRVHEDSSDELWDAALSAATIVGGLPLIQNDHVIIPGLMKELNFTLEDARDYAVIGCQEITGSGNDYPCPSGITPPYNSLLYSAIFVTAMNDGKNPFNGEQCSIHTGYLYEMKDIEEVKEAWKKLSLYFLKASVTINNWGEYLSEFYVTIPAISISVDGCMEQGLDCAWGGAKYNSHGGTGTGFATIADCLSTIEYMCFDKKLITTRQLYDAYMANWEGYEDLRQQIIRDVPHFGNNDPYADRFMKYAIDTYYWTCEQCSGNLYTKFKAGLYGASDHIAQGYDTYATPDGRRTGEPIADATSPAQGRDKNGPTAVLESSCCYDHSRFMDGIALNLRIHPSAVAREDGLAKLRDMTKAYLAAGGMETQYNIVSTETMRAAQEDPDAYKNLVVRIAGYSAYFVELSHDQQEDLISRTENLI